MSLPYADADTRRRTVLVVVLNNLEDLHRAAAEGWYRIPQRRAPRRIGADYLAFYQTGAFKSQAEAQTVTYYAPTRRYRLLTRRELLPDEPDHPAPTTTIIASKSVRSSGWKTLSPRSGCAASPSSTPPWIAC